MAQLVMRISRKGLDFIKKWEGFVPFLYDDLVRVNGRYVEWKGGKLIGTLTIGYGHTSAARGKYPMTLGSRITEARATQLLDDDLDPVEEFVNKVVKVPLTQGQFDALVSITYNMGEGNLKRSSLLARLNARDYAGARAAFMLYVNSKGRRLQGLVNRRRAEQVLWDTKDVQQLAKQKVIDLAPAEYESKGTVSATPREIDQPVQPNTAKTAEGASGLATTGLGGTGMTQQVNSALEKASEYAEQAASVVNTADALGVAPIGLASFFGPKIGAFFSYLFSSPLFWLFFVITVLGLVIFFVRRWKAKQEVIPGAYEMAGTPLPQLIAGDSGYAGIDTSDDPNTAYYREDPIYVDEDGDYDAPVDIDAPEPPRKRRATKKRKSK